MYFEKLRIAYEFSNGQLFPVILCDVIFSKMYENLHFQKTEIKMCLSGRENIFNIRFNLANLTFLLGELSKTKRQTNFLIILFFFFKRKYDPIRRNIDTM